MKILKDLVLQLSCVNVFLERIATSLELIAQNVKVIKIIMEYQERKMS